ncbi:MAG: glycosyltransferase family 39 protein, partial [Acidobacteria bacterium]|nr:glycosyltransferase family 39 protein [Acidobacteriota bacterium]
MLLIVAFLSFRGSDVGRLPTHALSFLRSLTMGSPFGTGGLAASILGVLIAALVSLSWYGLGDLVVHLARKGHVEETGSDQRSSRAFEWARGCALGAGVWSLLWFALGALKLYRRPTAAIALLIGLGLFVMAYKRHRGTRRSVESTDWPGRMVLFLIIMTGALALLAALAPPTAKDTLLYHLSLPKVFVAASGFTDVPYNIASFLPLGAEMHSVWAMLLGTIAGERTAEAAAGATQFAFFPLLVAFVYGWARQQELDRTWSLIAALLIASIPTAYYVAGNGYIDLALSLYMALSVHAMARWWTTLDREQLVYTALALGFALCLKLTAIFLVLPLAL